MEIYIKNLNDGKAARKDMNMYIYMKSKYVHKYIWFFLISMLNLFSSDISISHDKSITVQDIKRPTNHTTEKEIHLFMLSNQYIHSCFSYYSDLNIPHHWFSDPFPKRELMKYANRLPKWMGMALILRHADTECNLKMTATCIGLYFRD